MAISARIYRFNGTLRFLAIRITAEERNRNSLPKTFIVVAILFETINVTCFSIPHYGWQVGPLVTSRTTKLEVGESFA